MIRSLLSIILFLTLFAGARLPDIEPKDAVQIIHQILESHACHKKLDPGLIKRSIEIYIEALDPAKNYFLKKEVNAWLNLKEDFLKSVSEAIENGDFSFYNAIFEKMKEAIHRREKLEKHLDKLPQKVSFKDFQKTPFAENEEELKQRLATLRALQIKALDNLEKGSKEKALKRIIKRRNLQESEILTTDENERKKFVLTLALKALASSLDTHTAYFTPMEASQFLIQVQQRLSGIGAQLRDDLTGFTIVKIVDGGPAQKNSKLKENDRIIAIDKEPVVGMEINDAVELIRGKEGTNVLLTVLREIADNEEVSLDIEITRGEVVIKDSRLSSSTIPFGDGVIAHINLFSFYQDQESSSATDLAEEIMKIKRTEKLRGIILDLRTNSGGVLPQAVAVTGLFIMKGIVVSVKDNKGNVDSLRNTEGKTVWDGPLIVMTSKGSASAAEIVAQTLQDYGRALVVGDEHTFGKGTFQTFTLDIDSGKINPKGEYKVTRGTYYTVSGKSPQLVGVRPDIVVSGVFSKAEIGEKHTKYPIENSSIKENFEDDLSDIPETQREQAKWLYRFNLQPRLKTYQNLLPALTRNSEIRLKNDKFYQKFLTELQKEEDSKDLELFMEADLQFKETANIMKDLILLSE